MAKFILSVFNTNMKINSINYFNYNNYTPQNINNSESCQKGESVLNNKLNRLEFLGRSQVKFTGINNDESNEFDKTFFNDISKDLELSREDSDKFKKIVNKFLKKNNYSSTEDLCAACDDGELIESFIITVAEGLNLSDEKIEKLDDFFIKKYAVKKFSEAFKEDESLADTMLMFAAKSMKNNLVCENLLEKFNLDPQEKQNIFSHLNKLEQDIPPEQIAYEITEEYNLLSIDDFNYVLKTIKSRDKMFMDFWSDNS